MYRLQIIRDFGPEIFVTFTVIWIFLQVILDLSGVIINEPPEVVPVAKSPEVKLQPAPLPKECVLIGQIEVCDT